MFSIRPANRDNAASITTLLERSYTTLLVPDHDHNVLQRALPRITRAHLTDEQQREQYNGESLAKSEPDVFYSGTYYIATSNETNTIAGSGGWTRYKPDSMYPDENGHYHVTLRFFATDPDWTKKGVARSIWEQCLADWGCNSNDNDTTDKSVTIIWHCTSSLTAPDFYKRLGFKVIEYIDHPLDENCNLPCIQMKQTIMGSRVYEAYL